MIFVRRILTAVLVTAMVLVAIGSVQSFAGLRVQTDVASDCHCPDDSDCSAMPCGKTGTCLAACLGHAIAATSVAESFRNNSTRVAFQPAEVHRSFDRPPPFPPPTA